MANNTTFDYKNARITQKVYKYEEVKSNVVSTINGFNDYRDASDELVKRLQRLKIELIKECLESTGLDFGVTTTPIDMRNYIKGDDVTEEYTNQTILESIHDNYEMFVHFGNEGGPDSGMLIPITSKMGQENGLKIMNGMIKEFGLTPEQACAFSAIAMAESGCNPDAINLGELKGTNKASSASGGGRADCGEGLVQWTFTKTKNNVLNAIGKPSMPKCYIANYKGNGGAGYCTLDEQISMLGKWVGGASFKNVLTGIKSCTTAHDSTAVLYCHVVGGYKDTSEIPDQAEIDNMVDRYMRANPGSDRSAHFEKRYGYALAFLDAYNNGGTFATESKMVGEGGEGGDPSLSFGGGTLKVTGNTKHLEFQVKRGQVKDYSGRKGCFGQLYINGSYFCDCAERATNSTGKLHPTGKKFKIVTKPTQGNSKTGRADWMSKGASGNIMYQFAKISNGFIPQIMGTGAQGIRIHEGTGPTWSEGCLIVGTNKGGKFSPDSSLNAWKSIYSALLNADSANITYS